MIIKTQKIKNKKADVSILLLVILALILVGAALLNFNINLGKFGTKLINVKSVDSVYITEGEIDFYVDRSLEDSIKKDITQEELIENFKIELGKNKDSEGNYPISELKQVEEQASKIKIEKNEIGGDKLVFDLRFKIIKIFDKVSITYVYDNRFEKNLPFLEPINIKDIPMLLSWGVKSV